MRLVLGATTSRASALWSASVLVDPMVTAAPGVIRPPVADGKPPDRRTAVHMEVCPSADTPHARSPHLTTMGEE